MPLVWRSLGPLVDTALHSHKANVFQQALVRWEVRGVKEVSWFEVHLSHSKELLIIQGAFASESQERAYLYFAILAVRTMTSISMSPCFRDCVVERS